ncbi:MULTISPECIES: PadR family transcriptional regulator [Mesorhizobium]|uniref:PadR family transcriptional regulator n=1 Tax=Mesorhizobium denitrificans TaxID=2294114 RepID=A0A371XGE5_9HYPH|nr:MULTISPECIES: PadR family transcriptional regulator [Mesorhizobium]RFC68305.1 PadR family transcriptional regulator [Mesorhizobium denitrificans]
MFGHKHHHHNECGGWKMAGRGRGFGGPFGGRGGRGGPFGRHGDGPFGGRGRRMFDSGALRLVVLGLIAEEPRHGYDIIKALETKFQGAYSPSPGAIYPMLQMLEEADLVRSDAEGNKRLYSITDEGRAFLAEHAEELARINAQIDEASADVSGVALGEEMRALKWSLFGRMREGSLDTAKAGKALEILRRARKEIDEL